MKYFFISLVAYIIIAGIVLFSNAPETSYNETDAEKKRRIKREQIFMGGLGVVIFGWIIGAVVYSQISPICDRPGANCVVNEPASSTNYEDRYGSDDCTYDCSGHNAGYDWADENNICDTSYSNGNSESFNEGVQAWAEDNCN